MKKFIGIILTVIGTILSAIGILMTVLDLILKEKGQMSMSIVGGADGPTSIFLAGKVGNSSAVPEIVGGIVLLAIGIFMIVRKK